MSIRSITKLTMLALIVGFAWVAQAAYVPEQINYQGRITNTGGLPFNGVYDLTFSIYDTPSGGTAKWTETHTAVAVANGLFSIILGTTTPITTTTLDSDQRWLGITLLPGSEMTPRTKITSVAYAIRSSRADTAGYVVNNSGGDSIWSLNGVDAYRLNGNVGVGTMTPAATLDVVGTARFKWNSEVHDDGSRGPSFSLVSHLSGGKQYNLAVGEIAGKPGNFDIVDETIGGIPRLSIDADGNIGIGTFSPSQQLDVHTPNRDLGVRWIVDAGIDAGAFGRIASNNGRGLLTLGGPSDNASLLNTTGGWRWDNQLNVAGNVGIGTTSADARLTVVVPAGVNDVARFRSDNANSDLVIGAAGDQVASIYTRAGQGLSFGTNGGNERIRITSAGNVGIGTATPAFQLDVAGDMHTSGNLGVGMTPDAKFSVGNTTGTAASIRNSSGSLTTLWVSNNSTGEAITCGNQTSGATYVMHVIGYNNNAASNGLLVRGVTRIEGNLSITGSISKGSGSFKIDHPLDPQNKYLYHSFVESPDMKNVYDGVVVLGASGEGVVTLPDYFSALNKDFRYQLTCVGGYAPIFVSQEISDNTFRISGGQKGLKVCWQVTGIRKDPYAEQNRVPVEELKPISERGKYLYPRAYGLTEEFGVESSPTAKKAAWQDYNSLVAGSPR